MLGWRSVPAMFAGVLVAGVAVCDGRSAFAWGPDGHKTVATIADKLLKGTKAAQEVKAILDGVSLANAAVWADCAKGVDPKTFIYTESADYPECRPFEPSGEADMIAFVKRNATNCPNSAKEPCHKQYHYADIPIQNDDYKASYVGARSNDVTVAVSAAIAVLQGKAPPPQFSIKGKREALLILVHYVGDIHQPLHIGAVYLAADGKIVNPEPGHVDPATETRGGNEIIISGGQEKLHGRWDDILVKHRANKVSSAWLADAKSVPATTGPISGWPSVWASDTQKNAVKAFAGLKFGPKTQGKWSVKYPTGYAKSMNAIKKQQLTKAGARLAQLLTAIWPDAPVANASH